ncbi:MAG TPA: alpha/beta fold hydrolase [Myxococcales bacterium]|jgi:predicted alpha/beta-fold hydrolase|nr:alpha/beta fold hydrolase [Myxococcales bacterium]
MSAPASVPAPIPATAGWAFAPRTPFRPAAFISGPHAQTNFAYLTRSWRMPRLTRERWETPDGDFVDVDRVPAPPDAPHLAVFHGLEGSSRSGYVLAMLREAAGRGWGALALNFRSCSGEMNRQLQSYSSGETRDPAFAIATLRDQGVTGPLYAIGYSLGGNALLKLLAEQGDASLLSAAVAVSVPFDLGACARALDARGGWGWFYRMFFIRQLRRKALAKAMRFPGALDAERIRRSSTFREFDDLVTGPVNGFKDAEEYWARCSSGPMLHRIRRPTLLISAKDDPIARIAGMLDGLQNPHVVAVVTEQGGHVGFVSGSVLRPRFWAEEVAVQFLDERAQSPAGV